MAEGLTIKGTFTGIVTSSMGEVLNVVSQENHITTLGWDNICDMIGQTPQPGPITHLGIGWGAGATTPFDPAQSDLQGANTSRKTCSYTHAAGTTTFFLESVWGVNDPSATSITIEEGGTFLQAVGGTMISRSVLAATVKDPSQYYTLRWSFELGTA
ncbi:TPA: hypothetical protein DCX15_01320 [bacterium]|nr:hypothetical protein [bacterium]